MMPFASILYTYIYIYIYIYIENKFRCTCIDLGLPNGCIFSPNSRQPAISLLSSSSGAYVITWFHIKFPYNCISWPWTAVVFRPSGCDNYRRCRLFIGGAAHQLLAAPFYRQSCMWRVHWGGVLVMSIITAGRWQCYESSNLRNGRCFSPDALLCHCGRPRAPPFREHNSSLYFQLLSGNLLWRERGVVCTSSHTCTCFACIKAMTLAPQQFD